MVSGVNDMQQYLPILLNMAHRSYGIYSNKISSPHLN